jgi:hypothetical protein
MGIQFFILLGFDVMFIHGKRERGAGERRDGKWRQK